LALAGLFVAAGQLAFGAVPAGNPLLFAAYGWRNYFLYLPLAFIVAENFEEKDVDRILRLTLLLAVPVAAIVVVQFYAPMDSWINVGLGDSPESRFAGLALTEEHTRPMGPFTSDLGQREFVISGLAMVIAAWLGQKGLARIPRRELAAGTLAFLVCLAFSGSRGAVINAGILSLVAIGVILMQGGRAGRGRTLLWFAAAVTLFLVAYPVIFPESFHAIVERWQTANDYESTRFTGGVFGRALYGFIDFARLIGETPILGFGLGLGGNASTLLGVTIGGEVPVSIAETDWARHIVDLGPVVGLLYLLFRVALAAALARSALAALWRGTPLPIMLFGFVGLEILSGQITGQGTVNAYAWLFAGLCLAGARSFSMGVTDQGPDAPAPRFPNLMR
jgi:hypothetical protein